MCLRPCVPPQPAPTTAGAAEGAPSLAVASLSHLVKHSAHGYTAIPEWRQEPVDKSVRDPAATAEPSRKHGKHKHGKHKHGKKADAAGAATGTAATKQKGFYDTTSDEDDAADSDSSSGSSGSSSGSDSGSGTDTDTDSDSSGSGSGSGSDSDSGSDSGSGSDTDDAGACWLGQSTSVLGLPDVCVCVCVCVRVRVCVVRVHQLLRCPTFWPALEPAVWTSSLAVEALVPSLAQAVPGLASRPPHLLLLLPLRRRRRSPWAPQARVACWGWTSPRPTPTRRRW